MENVLGTLLQLTVVGRLLDEVEDLLGESLVGLGPCSTVDRINRLCSWVNLQERLTRCPPFRGLRFEVLFGVGFTA